MVSGDEAPASPTPAPGEASPRTVCFGRARASSAPAPEELTSIVRRSATDWMFIGASGTIYEAAAPLGPFVRTVVPPEPLARVVGAGASLLGITPSGGVLQWRDEAGWQRVALDAAAGASDPHARQAPRVFDIAVAEPGRWALALALPESLYASDDGGATWTRSPLPTMGLRKVGVLVGGGALLAEGRFASVAWDPTRSPAFSRVSVGLPPPDELTVHPEVDSARAPNATSVWDGRAAMTGDRYYEALHPGATGEPWLLAAGPIGGSLGTRPIPETGDCADVQLGASGKRLVAICMQEQGDSDAAAQVAQVLRSDDGGAAWSRVAKVDLESRFVIHLAVAPDGAALLTGACETSDGAAACKPTAPLLLRREDGAAALTLVAAPTLRAAAAIPAFSLDGRSAYLLGYRDGTGERLALFVSHDGGKTFAPRPLDTSGATVTEAGDRAASEGREPDGAPRSSARVADFQLARFSTVHPGEDGAVGLVLAADGALRYVTVDRDGRMLTVAPAPSGNADLAGFGRRVVASRSMIRDGQDVAQLWESLDGGATWTEVPELPALSRRLSEIWTRVACGASACLFGDALTRVGWGGQPAASPRSQPAARTPIVCDLRPASTWTRIDDVDERFNMLSMVVDASFIMRGRSVWSVLTRSPSGAASVVSAMLPESGSGEARLVTRALFPDAPPGARIATSVSHQMAGYAAARVRVPGVVDPRGWNHVGAPMRNVEIVWENWIDGASGRSTLANAGPFEPGDVEREGSEEGQSGEHLFNPGMLSVGVGGMLINPHSGSYCTSGDLGLPLSRSGTMFFFEPGGRLQQRLELPQWPMMGLGGSFGVCGDAILADGQPLGVGTIRQEGRGPVTEMLLAHRRPAAEVRAGSGASGAPWELDAVTVAPPDLGRARIAHTDSTYSGATVGVATFVAHTRPLSAWAMFQPFRGDGTLGPAQPLPTPLDVGDPPRPCSAAERASTARFEAPLTLWSGDTSVDMRDIGQRVLVSGAADPDAPPAPVELSTETVVLYGTPASPCVAGWTAWYSAGTHEEDRTAIISGDLAHAWLLRFAKKQRSELFRAIEVHPMACRFDPSAKAP